MTNANIRTRQELIGNNLMEVVDDYPDQLRVVIDELEFTNEQIGEMLRVCERLGNISAEYFCEEFIFDCDPEEVDRLHDDDYLKINWRLD